MEENTEEEYYEGGTCDECLVPMDEDGTCMACDEGSILKVGER